ncbi:hypothetical protein DCS_05923 [Drechmeria coniospora]|uniref:DUF7730 domain-containing protein n=1 Tax=Drechmeria coniospora TaxID=98403 RepID=A0A151GA59_DRECN|nr:hypothetical protein DCS_05923 [Drechmeria coniospora]KYK53974.1 hypothetical protein DCS_05923 [Drechmeria coniospora]
MERFDDLCEVFHEFCEECRYRYRRRGFPSAVSWIVVAIALAVRHVAWSLFMHCMKYNPWSRYNRNIRNQLQAETGLQSMIRGGTHRDIADSWKSPTACAHPASLDSKPNYLFARIPAEIRQQIVHMAFGEQILHMDLSFRYSSPTLDGSSAEMGVKTHAGLLGPLGCKSDLKTLVGNREKKCWIWYGCVCHRFSPNATPLSLGRRSNRPVRPRCDPDADKCLFGWAKCDEWPGEWPVKCRIGIMGWLLTCKLAYVEGIHVLYRTNTIHIASPALLRSLQHLLPPRRLSDLTSLELVWDPRTLRLGSFFASNETSKRNDEERPLFPSLQYLRIQVSFMDYEDNTADCCTHLIPPIGYKAGLARSLRDQVFPEMDALLERAVRPTAEVTLSCPDWPWYDVIEARLVEEQGRDRTKPQQADIGGLKCWMETPKSAPDVSDGDVESAQGNGGPRQGYWIHAPMRMVKFEYDGVYDWDRHRQYGLGDAECRPCQQVDT